MDINSIKRFSTTENKYYDTQIKEEILSNGKVFIDKGIYKCRNLSFSNIGSIEITGCGEYSVLKSDESCKTWDYTMRIQKSNNVILKNITLDGNYDNVAGDSQKGVANLYLTNCNNVLIDNCTFQNNRYVNIVLINCNNIKIQNSKFLNSDCGIILSEMPSNNIYIHNNYFDGHNYSEPISIYASKNGYNKNIVITNNIIKNHIYGSGIGVKACDGLIISNNTIENCSTGIYIEKDSEYGVLNAIISNNLIINNVYEAIISKYLVNSHIKNNIISNSGTVAMRIKNNENITIENNSISNSNYSNSKEETYSIFINGLKNSNISHNVFENENFLTAIIYLGGTSGFKTTNNYFLSNISKIDSVMLFKRNFNFVKYNTYNQNFGLLGNDSLAGESGGIALNNKNNISKIQSLSFDNPWGEIRFPQFEDYFYITSSLGTETYVGYLKSNNLYPGREVTMIFKTDNLKFSNSNTQNLQLKNSEVLTSSINGILKLVYNGDKWVEILRT